MFFVAGIGIAVFIEFLLISKRNKSAPDLILTVWMFVISVHLLLLYGYVTDDIFRFPFLLGVELPLPLLHGVMLYLYVGALTRQLPGTKSLLALHFIPAAGTYLYLVAFFLLPSDQKIAVYRHQGAGYELFTALKSYAISLSGITYVVWSALLLRTHRRKIRDRFSDLEKVNLQWLQVLTLGMGGIWILVIFFRNEILIMGGMVVFIFLIGFFGVRQTEIFSQGQPVEEEKEEKEEKKKYPKSGLTDEATRTLHQALKQLMTESALYRKSDLSIDDLAAKLGVHANHLSQIINQEEKKNFYDFVNTYRIEEFKRLIAMPKNRNFTLLSLAFECGFNSKSSFNRYFKKATGLTPSKYFSALSGDPSLPA